jgi:type IV secretion system protein VirD4
LRGARSRLRPGLSEPVANSRDDWSGLASQPPKLAPSAPSANSDDQDGGVRRDPTLPEHEEIAREPGAPGEKELPLVDEDQEDDAARVRALRVRSGRLAQQATLDPDDGIAL